MIIPKINKFKRKSGKLKTFDLQSDGLVKKSIVFNNVQDRFTDVYDVPERIYIFACKNVVYTQSKMLFVKNILFGMDYMDASVKYVLRQIPYVIEYPGNDFFNLHFFVNNVSFSLDSADGPIYNAARGKFGAFYKGRLFGYYNGQITVSKKYDEDYYINHSESFSIYQIITLGEGRGLYVIKGRLFFFTDNTIVEIIVKYNEKEFMIKKLYNVNNLKIFENSLLQIGEKVYFINDKKLCSFDGEEIKHYPTSLEKLTDFTCERNGGKDLCYILNISQGSVKSTFIYDFAEDKEYITGYVKALSDKEGLFLDETTGEVIQLDFALQDGRLTTFNDSVSTNFGVNKEKKLCEINFKITGSCRLSISGDFGETYYDLTSGVNSIVINKISNSFRFDISNKSSDFNLTNCIVKYVETGE